MFTRQERSFQRFVAGLAEHEGRSREEVRELVRRVGMAQTRSRTYGASSQEPPNSGRPSEDWSISVIRKATMAWKPKRALSKVGSSVARKPRREILWL